MSQPEKKSAPRDPLLERYAPPSGFFDELLDAEGRPRERWAPFLEGMAELGTENFAHREEQLRRLIAENGITYNVYSDPGHRARPWTMDIVPLIIEQREAEAMEEALGQRARLFNLILRDVYGPQRLLKSGQLPPMLILANPRFLRPCHGLLPWNHRHVQLYAADLARAPDGAWWVVNDRLDAPSGLGYSFENRIISTRILPELFHRYEVRRLQPFLRLLSEAFARLAPKGKAEPNIVFLTPGPANETYFEQSYLARLLGYPLVEGADLTVRNHAVFLKTIAGMQAVDVIVRRIDSEWLDPLELRADSLLGVPGLLGALRHRRVAVVNTPGAGVLETAALPAFLPGICRNLLGEDLLVPSVASWWCGQPRECAYVLEHLETLLIKPTFPARGKRDYHGPTLARAEAEALRRAIRHAPEYFCAQETVAQSTAPVFLDGALEPRHSLFRTFLIPRQGRFEMMPGGLSRIATESHSGNVSMQIGGESKDTWVHAPVEEGRAEEPTLSETPIGELRRDTENLPSRVADNLFWLGRYVERTESLARVIRAVLTAIQEEYGTRYHLGVLPLLTSFLNAEQERILLESSRTQLDLRLANRYIDHQLHDLEVPGSLAENFGHLQRISTAVKERLSLDAWGLLRRVAEAFDKGRRSKFAEDFRLDQLETVLESVAGFSGMLGENMTRGPGWTFLEIGRRLERGLALCNLLYSAIVPANPHETSTLAKLLGCTDCALTYRRRYLANLQPRPVLDLLVRDESNPRSLAFQIVRLRRHLETLPHHHPPTPDNHIDRLALRLYSEVGLFDLEAALVPNAAGHRASLADRLDLLAGLFLELSEELSARYFSIIRVEAQGVETDLL
jgi:uncharacterized circularly permuted ATP-grasp superfamily protein/uncharacterized alpha-E superfamily protein